MDGDALDGEYNGVPQELLLLAGNVSRLRRELGWSTRAFAEHARMSRSFLARIEQASLGTVSIATVERLAKGFGVHPATLFAGPHPAKHQVTEEALRSVVAMAVRTRRVRARLTQEELAAQAGVGRSHIAEVEAGTQNSSVDVLARLAAALNCPMWSLLSSEVQAGNSPSP